MSPQQIQLIHVARHKVFGRHDDASYRLLLKNVAGVDSSRDLTNQTFEDVMAVLEDSGFTDQVHGPGYWRRKAAGQGGTDRMAHKIRQLWDEGERRYPLDALVNRFSAGRTSIVEQLTPREAWNLIEMLKARGQKSEVTSQLEDPIPF